MRNTPDIGKEKPEMTYHFYYVLKDVIRQLMIELNKGKWTTNDKTINITSNSNLKIKQIETRYGLPIKLVKVFLK